MSKKNGSSFNNLSITKKVGLGLTGAAVTAITMYGGNHIYNQAHDNRSGCVVPPLPKEGVDHLRERAELKGLDTNGTSVIVDASGIVQSAENNSQAYVPSKNLNISGGVEY
ncbi:hypothetical protein H7171_04200, partial [Candidatus Saccharibacteria bacterium]|nr:hypothetical protein [Candidatus Saccharibacteria bacterium]